MPVPATRGNTPLANPTAVAAGYDPERLDPTIRKYFGELDRNLNMIKSLGTRVTAAVDQIVEGDAAALGSPGETAEALTNWYDRLTRAGLNGVKALDQLTRLRSFLAGGPDSRPDLSHRGEHDLRSMLEDTVAKLGLRLVPIIDVTPTGGDTHVVSAPG